MDSSLSWIIGITIVSAWLTHIVVCISASAWTALIAGGLFFPIAIIHGIMIWMGFPIVN